MMAEFGGYLKLIMTIFFFVYSARVANKMKEYLARAISPQGDHIKDPTFFKESVENNSVLELVESRTDVRDFQKRISFIEVLQNRYQLKSWEQSVSGPLQKAGPKALEQEEEPGIGQRMAGNLNQHEAAVLEKSSDSASLSEAYHNIKATSMLSSSNVKKIINLYFIELLKSDFEAK